MTDVAEKSAGEIKTVGDFLEYLRCLDGSRKVHISLWLDGAKESVDENFWAGFVSDQIDQENILMLAVMLQDKIAYEASILESKTLYDHCLKDGHALLQEVYRKSVELGIEVELTDIDIPLTPSEVMTRAGLVDIGSDGKIILSETGRQLAKEMADLLENPPNEEDLKSFRIRITKTPRGDAPEEVRKHWIGVEMTAQDYRGLMVGFVTRQFQPSTTGYQVMADEAIEALAKADKQAAVWFRRIIPEGSGRSLIFQVDEAEIIG